VNDAENDVPPDTPKGEPEREREPMSPSPESITPSSESSEESTESPPQSSSSESSEESTESPSKEQPELTIITISQRPYAPRCLLCSLVSRNFPRSPFGSSGNHPTFFRIPSPRYRPPIDRNPTESASGLFPFRDPLANYTRPQKFRQLMQDMIGLQLMKFENLINEQMDNEENSSQMTGFQNVLNGLKQFQQVLKDNQLFNFTEVMKNRYNSDNESEREQESELTHERSSDHDRPRFEPLIRISGTFN